MALPNLNQAKLDSDQLKALAALANFKARRKRSEFVFLGLPLYSIAFGPDFSRGEMRGHAKGFFAFGDVATGVLAFGGVAIGGVAFGALALGLMAFGGLSVGLFLALGGAAIGTIALGGGALGVVALGGAAAGYYAAGGAAYGAYVLDAMHQSREAIEFFSQWNFLHWFGVRELRR
jgi:hypothetical protein